MVDTQLFLWKILWDWPKDFFYNIDPFSLEVELVFLNTCGFISTARSEMLDTIKNLLRKNKKICIFGCAVHYFEQLLKENTITNSEHTERENIKKNENIYFLSWSELANFDPKMLQSSKKTFEIKDSFQRIKSFRAYTNLDLWFEYLKIAEWCNNNCSFCIIPQIRWKQISLSIEDLVLEVKNLISNGAKEIILIAQDTTRYGVDLYGQAKLIELLETIDDLPWDFVYRVLYLYPDILTQKHLAKFQKLKKFIPYFDIPLQHASPKILKSMWRFYNHEMSLSLLKYIRENFENSFIRTNFIIGFPGETEEDFQLLMDFIQEDYFDNISLFEYHDEILAESYKLSDKIDEKTIRSRFLKAQKLVNKIQKNRAKIRKKKEQIWTISNIWFEKDWTAKLFVRPFLHCPEIDEEDEIWLDQILESLDGDELDIGMRVRY